MGEAKKYPHIRRLTRSEGLTTPPNRDRVAAAVVDL